MGVIQKVFVIALALQFAGACKDKNPPENVKKDWWQTAQFYQIYPRSFKDSDGDGIGDLKGITSQLQYLKDLGITATWLSPIFKSPMADFGYDISNFYDIQEEYGTMADFQEMINKANELGIKIILDFVPNHSSDEHEYFLRSINREEGYEDFYVWADGKIDANGNRQPPSNWLQVFRGSAWEWNEKRQQYYLHQFVVKQPDFNYRNPAVVAEMKNVLKFWMDRGVAGFRIDAVPNLFEVEANPDGTYPDEELSGLTDDPEDRAYLKTDLIESRPETIDMIYQWRQVMDEYQQANGGDTRILMIETYAPVNYTMQMYGNSTQKGAHLPFNFNLITQLKDGVDANVVQKAVDAWLLYMPKNGTANWVIGNHDQRRAASRYGSFRADAMTMLVMMLPGASVTYQGEELAMIDGVISWEDTVDPAACNSNPEIFEKFTRDPSRTPFQWTNGMNAGFSTGPKTWLPLAPNYDTLNVESESAADRSHLKIYKALIELRKSSKTLQNGYYKYKALNDNVFVMKRYLAGQPSVVYVANFGATNVVTNLLPFDVNLPTSMTLKIQSLSSTKTENSPLSINSIALKAGEALVLTST